MACVLLCGAWIASAQEKVPLTLFQLIARSDLVIHARVLEGETKYAAIEVVEAFRGTPPSESLRIDFRDLNFERRGQEVVVFAADEEYILLLERPVWRKPKEKNRDIFGLFHGRRGRILLPAEGTGITVEAVRELSALVGRSPEEQVQGLRTLVLRENPVLRQAALEEIARLRAATPSDLQALNRLLRDPAPAIRAATLTIVREVMGVPGDEAAEAEKRTMLETCRQHARNDPAEVVRVEAVRVMGAWTVREEVIPDLRAIAAGDASQVVRYEAQRILYLWGATGRGR